MKVHKYNKSCGHRSCHVIDVMMNVKMMMVTTPETSKIYFL